MSDKSSIEWCDATWNPVTGCTKISSGCKNCYAATFAERWRGTKGHYFENGFDLTLRPDKLNLPSKWKSPKKIFVNSMSDLFHKDVPDDFIDKVFETMCAVPQHTYMILTKRPERMRDYLLNAKVLCTVCMGDGDCPYCYGGKIGWKDHPYKNVWLGTSVENQKAADERIPLLLQTPAAVRFLSCEPLLGPVNSEKYMWPTLWHWDGNYKTPQEAIEAGAYAERKRQGLVSANRVFVDWVIVGGESGHGARPMHPNWARSLRDQCQAAGVSFFFKQWGEFLDLQVATCPGRIPTLTFTRAKLHTFEDGTEMLRVGKGKAGRLLDGREWNEFPEATL